MSNGLSDDCAQAATNAVREYLRSDTSAACQRVGSAALAMVDAGRRHGCARRGAGDRHHRVDSCAASGAIRRWGGLRSGTRGGR